MIKKDNKGHFSGTNKAKQKKKNTKKKRISPNSFKSFFMKKDISYFHESILFNIAVEIEFLFVDIVEQKCGNHKQLTIFFSVHLFKKRHVHGKCFSYRN